MPKPRKPSNDKPLKTLRIFCEGEKTEPIYLKSYIESLDIADRKTVFEIAPTKKNTALQLVDEAIALKKSKRALDEDEFWVVYDREATSKYPDAIHAKAFDKARKANIKVALCNVCFEYWLLLHFVETDAPYENFDDLRKNSLLEKNVRKACGCNYGKSMTSLFPAIKNKIDDARRRGQRLNEQGKRNARKGKNKPYEINPYVGIVDLLQAIDDFS